MLYISIIIIILITLLSIYMLGNLHLCQMVRIRKETHSNP
jgi:hypothetical protein